MPKFLYTPAGQAFIATGESRETSQEIMSAIAFHARNTAEATKFLEGTFPHTDGRWQRVIWETATKNGLIDDEDLFWGGRTLRSIIQQL